MLNKLKEEILKCPQCNVIEDVLSCFPLSKKDKFEYSNFCLFHKEKIIRFDERKKVIDILEEIENPYPLDIFLRLELSENETEQINHFLKVNFDFPLDRLSAEIMRRARDNLKNQIIDKLKEKNGN